MHATLMQSFEELCIDVHMLSTTFLRLVLIKAILEMVQFLFEALATSIWQWESEKAEYSWEPKHSGPTRLVLVDFFSCLGKWKDHKNRNETHLTQEKTESEAATVAIVIPRKGADQWMVEAIEYANCTT